MRAALAVLFWAQRSIRHCGIALFSVVCSLSLIVTSDFQKYHLILINVFN